MLWKDICLLSTHMEDPWLVGGEFNVVLNAKGVIVTEAVNFYRSSLLKIEIPHPFLY